MQAFEEAKHDLYIIMFMKYGERDNLCIIGSEPKTGGASPAQQLCDQRELFSVLVNL